MYATQTDKTKTCHGCKLHRGAVRATGFIRPMDRENLCINQVLIEKSQVQIMKNREAVISIDRSIHFPKKQNLPLRGHRNDSHYFSVEGINSESLQNY